MSLQTNADDFETMVSTRLWAELSSPETWEQRALGDEKAAALTDERVADLQRVADAYRRSAEQNRRRAEWVRKLHEAGEWWNGLGSNRVLAVFIAR